MILIKSMKGMSFPVEPGGSSEDPLWPNQVVEEMVGHLASHSTEIFYQTRTSADFHYIFCVFGGVWDLVKCKNETDCESNI